MERLRARLPLSSVSSAIDIRLASSRLFPGLGRAVAILKVSDELQRRSGGQHENSKETSATDTDWTRSRVAYGGVRLCAGGKRIHPFFCETSWGNRQMKRSEGRSIAPT